MPEDRKDQYGPSDLDRSGTEAETDRSAGEAGELADMDYYRKTRPVGARLALGAWAPALVLLALIAIAALWVWAD